MKAFKSLIAAGLFITSASPALSATVFSENFDSENGGAGALNYTGFTQWTVTSGTVDLIGNGFFDFLPGNGLYVDLDGSSSNSGILFAGLTLAPGNYILEYSLAGSQRGSTESVDVLVDVGLGSQTHTLTSGAPFSSYSLPFTVTSGGGYSISFENAGGDNVGLLLDNVSVRTAPTPEAGPSIVCFALGMAGIVSLRRRLRK